MKIAAFDSPSDFQQSQIYTVACCACEMIDFFYLAQEETNQSTDGYFITRDDEWYNFTWQEKTYVS